MNQLILAAEAATDRSLWYPTILGALVVIAAVGLFCGTIYLLLATNLGARLGFLVAAAGLSGFMVLLSFLWITTASPLNTLKGRVPEWVAVESIEGGDFARSKVPAIQTIEETGHRVDLAEQTNVKAAVDQAVVIQAANVGEEQVAAGNKFAVYQSANDYLVTDTWETGGGNVFSQVDVKVNSAFPFVHVSLHKPLYAAVNICPVDQAKLVVPFGDPIPEPQCDTSKPITSLVFEKDLGSLRVPPVVALVASSILFGLTLLGLHWRERDLQAQAAALQAEAERTTAEAADQTPEKV